MIWLPAGHTALTRGPPAPILRIVYKIHYRAIGNQVYTLVKRMILVGELEPGRKLVQDELAERLGVSRTPLLSALSKLEKEMLVKSVARRGMFVRRFDTGELAQVYEVRLRLEPYAAGQAARVRDDAAAEAIVQRAHDYANLAAEPNTDMREADYDFHMDIMRASGNDLVFNISSSYNIIAVANTLGLMKTPAESAYEHTAIAAAILARDEIGAMRHMFCHIDQARRRILAKVKAGTDRTAPPEY